MAVEIAAVDVGGLGVRRGLPRVFDDLLQPAAAQRHTGHLGHVKVGIPGGGNRQLQGIDQALGIPHPAQAGGELNKKLRAVSVHARRQIPPARENGAAAVDPRKISELIQFDDGVVDTEADRDQPGGDQAHPALGPLDKIADHLGIGPAGFLTHGDIAHGGHHQPVFHGHVIDPDGGEQGIIRVQPFGHPAAFQPGVVMEPVAVAIHQALDAFVRFQQLLLAFANVCRYYSAFLPKKKGLDPVLF